MRVIVFAAAFIIFASTLPASTIASAATLQQCKQQYKACFHTMGAQMTASSVALQEACNGVYNQCVD